MAKLDEIDFQIATNKPRCMDCYYFHPHDTNFGACRQKAPPWVTMHRLSWCGQWHSQLMTRDESTLLRIEAGDETY